MINLQVITILQVFNIIILFFAGFFIGRAYELRKQIKAVQKLLDDLERSKPPKGGDITHGKNI